MFKIDYNTANELSAKLNTQTSNEEDLLTDFEQEVESPFLKENRRKSVTELKGEKKDTTDENETFSFDDLGDSKSDESDKDTTDGEFSRDIIEMLVNGIDYATDKGAELMGYEADITSTHIEEKKQNLIKYATIVLDKYDFKLTPEHMLLITLVFYARAKVGQIHKKDKDKQVTENSQEKTFKSEKPISHLKVMSKKETVKPKIKQSIL